MFFLLAVIVTVAEKFTSKSGMIGGQVIIYSMMIYFTHHAILSGRFDIWGRTYLIKGQRPLSLRFLGLVFLTTWLPMIAGVTLGFIVLTRPTTAGMLPLLVITVVPLWISLTFLGTKIPRHVWVELTGDDNIKHNKRTPSMGLRRNKAPTLEHSLLCMFFGAVVGLGLA